jgi:Tfp pilus assembly protein PilO
MYLALATVSIGGMLCYFQFSKYQEVERRVSLLAGQVKDAQSVKPRLADAETKVQGARDSLKHLESSVSASAYIPSLLHDLDAFGRANGLDVTGVRPSDKKTGDDKTKDQPYKELSIQVTGTGSYDAIEKFVDNLPTFPKIVAARMVSIQPNNAAKGTADASNQLQLTVDLRAYVFRDDGKADAATPSTAPGQAAAAPVKTALLKPTTANPINGGRTRSEG